MIDLHVHLDGSLSFDMVRKLAELQYQEIYNDEKLKNKMVAPKDCQDLNDYLTKFEYPLQLLQTKEALELCTYELLKLQQRQGLDLSKYRNKKVTRYSYKVTNYKGEGDVIANLFIHRGRIVACDISSQSPDGFVIPLTQVERESLK